MFWPAIFRFKEFAPIEKVYYDTDKCAIKSFKFPHVYTPVADYILKHEQLLSERYEFMYERMAKHSKLMAAAFVNSAYYMLMYADHVEGCDLDGGDIITSPGYYDYSSIQNKNYIPVGFERTYCPAIGALITPSRIYYDPEIDKIYYKGEWLQFDKGRPAEYKSKLLYKEMVLKKNINGVVYIDTGEHIYLK